MTNVKDVLKELGSAVRSSNSGHQAMLKARLSARANDVPVSSGFGVWRKYLLVATSASVFIAAVIAFRPAPSFDVAINTGPAAPTYYAEEEASLSDAAVGLGDVSEIAYENRPPRTTAQYDDIIDYENEHGAMLEKTTRISLLTTEGDTVDQVEQLFTSLGGHISSISTYDMTQPVSFTGIVPADSYFMFRQELRDLVSADKYFSEVLNATDLIPSAISLDEQITKTSEEIASLRKQIADSKDQNQKVSLERQLRNRETQLDSLQGSREGLDSRVAYTSVTVMVDEIPGFWETRESPDLRRLVTGFGMPSYFQQIWINVLTVGFWTLEIMSYAIWLVIPLTVWLVYRRRQRLAWRELD